MNWSTLSLFDLLTSIIQNDIPQPLTYAHLGALFNQYNLQINQEFYERFLEFLKLYDDLLIKHNSIDSVLRMIRPLILESNDPLLARKLQRNSPITIFYNQYLILIHTLTDINTHMDKVTSRRHTIINNAVDLSFVPVVKYDFYLEGIVDVIGTSQYSIQNVVQLSPTKILCILYLHIEVFNLHTKELQTRMIGKRSTSVVVINSSKIAYGTLNGDIYIQDTRLKKSQTILTGHTRKVTFVFNLPYGRLVSGSLDGTVRIWNYHELLKTLRTGLGDDITCGVLLRGTSRLITGAQDSSIQVWDLHNETFEFFLGGHHSSIVDINTFADGRVISASTGHVLVWDLNSTKLPLELTYAFNLVTNIVIVNDNSFVCGYSDNNLRVWNVVKRNYIILHGHTDTITCVAILPNGQIISGSVDGTLRIWNQHTGICERILYSESVMSILIMDDILITGGENGIVNTWK